MQISLLEYSEKIKKRQKTRKMISQENLYLLVQLISSSEDLAKKLEESYEKKELEKFKKLKEELLKFQKQISQII